MVNVSGSVGVTPNSIFSMKRVKPNDAKYRECFFSHKKAQKAHE